MNSNPSMTEEPQQLTATECRIATLWKDVLETPELPRAADNFFALGGDSTAMVMVELQINDEFSVELPAGAMLSAQSLSELSAMVDKHIGPASAIDV
jgi:acyl carrier protein